MASRLLIVMIRYSREIVDDFYIESGLNYAKVDVEIKPPFMGMPIISRNEELKLLSIPLFAKYVFWHYAFINGGPLVDFQLSDSPTINSQSGIGCSLGFGGEYDFKHFLIYVNPDFKRHDVIPFEKYSHRFQDRLTEFGIQFGIGYTF